MQANISIDFFYLSLGAAVTGGGGGGDGEEKEENMARDEGGITGLRSLGDTFCVCFFVCREGSFSRALFSYC